MLTMTFVAVLVAVLLAFTQLAGTTSIIEKSPDVEGSTTAETTSSDATVSSFVQSTTEQCDESSSSGITESALFTNIQSEGLTRFGTNNGTNKNSTARPRPQTSLNSKNRGSTVSNRELEELSEMLFSRDVNNAWQYIQVNLQNRATRNSSVDNAPGPLLTVSPDAFRIPTIQRVVQMYDNYQLDTRQTEHTTPEQTAERDQLIGALLKTEVMSRALRFLADRGFIRNNESDFENTLRKLWFSLYGRGGGRSSSSGFEHVFLSEVKRGRHVIGLHNWIYFNAAEAKQQANYLGYIKQLNLGDRAAVLSLHFSFNSIDKPITSIFVGTSPELEMALYTVCFHVRPGKKCRVSLGGSKFRIITYELVYKGSTLPVIGSAYPLI